MTTPWGWSDRTETCRSANHFNKWMFLKVYLSAKSWFLKYRHTNVLEDPVNTILHSVVSKKTVILLVTTMKIYDTVWSVAGTRLHVLPTVMNDLLKEVEQIFKQHGDCEHCFFVCGRNVDFILFILCGFEWDKLIRNTIIVFTLNLCCHQCMATLLY